MPPIFRAGLLRLQREGLLWLRLSLCQAVLRPNGLCWYQPALCLCCVTLPSWPWEDGAVHLQSLFCTLAGSHRICASLHYFDSAVSPAHFPQLKELLFCTCRAKRICLGGVKAVCMPSQPSVVGEDVGVVSGPSQAETGELTQLTKDGVVVSMLQGGAVLHAKLCSLCLHCSSTLCSHWVDEYSESGMRDYCLVAVLSVALKERGKATKILEISRCNNAILI